MQYIELVLLVYIHDRNMRRNPPAQQTTLYTPYHKKIVSYSNSLTCEHVYANICTMCSGVAHFALLSLSHFYLKNHTKSLLIYLHECICVRTFFKLNPCQIPPPLRY